MKWFLYNGLFAVAYLAMLPSFLLRMKRRGGYRVRMGKNAVIYQNVTFGALRDGDTSAGRLPVVGDGCTFFSGCCVLGGITVADGTVVGANAVLTRSTERGGTYAGLPARRVDAARAAGEGCA